MKNQKIQVFLILKYSYNHLISSLLPFENLYYVLCNLRAYNQPKMLWLKVFWLKDSGKNVLMSFENTSPEEKL